MKAIPKHLVAKTTRAATKSAAEGNPSQDSSWVSNILGMPSLTLKRRPFKKRQRLNTRTEGIRNIGKKRRAWVEGVQGDDGPRGRCEKSTRLLAHQVTFFEMNLRQMTQWETLWMHVASSAQPREVCGGGRGLWAESEKGEHERCSFVRSAAYGVFAEVDFS
jgi:hypothetical protein